MKRYTINECQTLTDYQLLYRIVSERRSTLTNPYTPLSERLNALLRKLEERKSLTK